MKYAFVAKLANTNPKDVRGCHAQTVELFAAQNLLIESLADRLTALEKNTAHLVPEPAPAPVPNPTMLPNYFNNLDDAPDAQG